MHNSNYLRLAIIVICNATIIPIDAMIGNNKEFSWDDAFSIELTDEEILSVLTLMLLLAVDRVSSNPEISDFNVFNSTEVSSKTELSLLICLLIPPRFWLNTWVAPNPFDDTPSLKTEIWKTCVPSWFGVKSKINELVASSHIFKFCGCSVTISSATLIHTP